MSINNRPGRAFDNGHTCEQRNDGAGSVYVTTSDVCPACSPMIVELTERERMIVDVRDIYGDAAAALVADGWTVDSAIDHIQGRCDRVYCTGDHMDDGSAVVETEERIEFAVFFRDKGAGLRFGGLDDALGYVARAVAYGRDGSEYDIRSRRVRTSRSSFVKIQDAKEI